MKISRRHFIGSLMLGSVLDIANVNHLSHAATAKSPRAQRSIRRAQHHRLPAHARQRRAARGLECGAGRNRRSRLSAQQRPATPSLPANDRRRRVHDFGDTTIEPQPFETDQPWLDGAGYAPNIAWTLPEDLASGVYFLNGLPDIFINVRASRRSLKRRRAHSLATAVLVPTNTINAYSTTLECSTHAHPLRVPVVRACGR